MPVCKYNKYPKCENVYNWILLLKWSNKYIGWKIWSRYWYCLTTILFPVDFSAFLWIKFEKAKSHNLQESIVQSYKCHMLFAKKNIIHWNNTLTGFSHSDIYTKKKCNNADLGIIIFLFTLLKYTGFQKWRSIMLH